MSLIKKYNLTERQVTAIKSVDGVLCSWDLVELIVFINETKKRKIGRVQFTENYSITIDPNGIVSLNDMYNDYADFPEEFVIDSKVSELNNPENEITQIFEFMIETSQIKRKAHEMIKILCDFMIRRIKNSFELNEPTAFKLEELKKIEFIKLNIDNLI